MGQTNGARSVSLHHVKLGIAVAARAEQVPFPVRRIGSFRVIGVVARYRVLCQIDGIGLSGLSLLHTFFSKENLHPIRKIPLVAAALPLVAGGRLIVGFLLPGGG